MQNHNSALIELAWDAVALEGIAYDIDVLVGSKRPLDPQLQQALSLIATPVGQEYRVQLQGDLR